VLQCLFTTSGITLHRELLDHHCQCSRVVGSLFYFIFLSKGNFIKSTKNNLVYRDREYTKMTIKKKRKTIQGNHNN
jgi:hypothetical protein